MKTRLKDSPLRAIPYTGICALRSGQGIAGSDLQKRIDGLVQVDLKTGTTVVVGLERRVLGGISPTDIIAGFIITTRYGKIIVLQATCAEDIIQAIVGLLLLRKTASPFRNRTKGTGSERLSVICPGFVDNGRMFRTSQQIPKFRRP